MRRNLLSGLARVFGGFRKKPPKWAKKRVLRDLAMRIVEGFYEGSVDDASDGYRDRE